MGSNLFIRKSLSNERYKLLLAPCQTSLRFRSETWHSTPIVGHILKQRQAQSGRANGLALMSRSYSCDDIEGRCILQNIANCSRPNCLEKGRRIVDHIDQNEFQLRSG